MQNTLILQLIQSFRKAELREAQKFVDSPFFNQREDLKILFAYLSECVSALQVIPSRQQVFAHLFPGENYNDQKLRLLLSYLLRLLEQFLQVKGCLEAPLHTSHFLLAAYRQKNLPGHFAKAFKSIRHKLDKHQLKHPEYFLANYLLEYEHYQLLSKGSRTGEQNLQELENHLHTSFLSMKLRQACFLMAHQAVYNTDYELGMLDEVLAEAKTEKYLRIPAIAVYYYCYQTLYLPEGEQFFQDFKAQLIQNIPFFPKREMRDLFLLAINFCIRKINENRKAYLGEALELYKQGLNNDLLIENKQISRFTYTNIVGVALRMRETEWVDWFIHAYRKCLESSRQEVTYSLCAARLEYVRRNYRKALLYLQKADYKDLINHMVARILQLKIFYELEEYDLLESHLKNMQDFIRRNKKVGYHQQNYRNIIRLTRKLLRSNPYDKSAVRQLQESIEHANPLTEKEWLLEQLRRREG